MCSIQQQHLKQYPDPTLKPPYPGGPIKQSSYDTSLHPQMHPYMQKESPLPAYMQKDMQYTPPQCFQKFNMQPPQYGNNYAPESNSFLATLSKINPRMAQSIISDPHIREASIGYHNVDQNHGYTHAQRLYPSQPTMHTSPGYQGGHRNLATAPQGYSCAQQYAYKPPPESYNRLPQYQAPNPLGQTHELPTRQTYRDNIPLPMNYSAMPQKLSQCAQLEYSQHYQHRRYQQMPPEYYPQNYKNPYIQNQDLPPVAETAVPSARMKQFWESWGEEEVEAIPETVPSDPEKRKDDRPTEQLYVLGATEIPRDSLGQYVEIEALPENVRELYENGSIIIKATTTEDTPQDMEVVASSSNRINILDHKRILPGATAGEPEQVVNLHILEATNQEDAASKPSEPETGWFVEEKTSPKSMPTISDMFEEEVAPEQVAETETQSEVCTASVEEASTEKQEDVAETTKDSITDLFKTEVEDKTNNNNNNNIPEEEVESGKSKVVEGCSVIVSRRKTIEEIVQKITFKKNSEQDSTSICIEEKQATEPKDNDVVEKVHEEQVDQEEKKKVIEEATTVVEVTKIEDVQEKPGVETLEDAFETEPTDDDPNPSFDENVTTMEETSETQEDVKDPTKTLPKIDAFQLENNNVLINVDGALLEIKVSYEGKKKIITVVPYAGDSESEVSEIEEEAHSEVLVENSEELQLGEEIDATESVVEEEADEEELQQIEEVAAAEVEVETAEEDEEAVGVEEQMVDAEEELQEIDEVAADEVEVETVEEEEEADDLEEQTVDAEEELQQIEDVAADEVEVETAEEEVDELESRGEEEAVEEEVAADEVEVEAAEEKEEEVADEEVEAAEIETGHNEDLVVEQLLSEETKGTQEQVLDGEAAKREEDHSFAEVQIEETKCREVDALEDEDTPELEAEVEQPLTEVEVEEQPLEEFETHEKLQREANQLPAIQELSDDEVFLEADEVTTVDGVDEVVPEEKNETPIVEVVGPEEPTNEGSEVTSGTSASVDQIEIEEAAADSTQTTIATDTEVQKPNLLTKASRKHFSDDDMAVKSETQTKLASKRRRELKERRVTISEDLPRVVKEDEGPPVKKVRFAKTPMINSSFREGSMRDQVEEATFEEKVSKRRKAKFDEKSYFAVDLTKNRESKNCHLYSRPVRPKLTKDLPECEVTTTTKTVEDKIEVPASNNFHTRTDETEVTSSTKAVVNEKSFVSRSVSEDSSDGGQKKRLTLAEYANRKKRLINTSASSPVTKVPLESQVILKQLTTKLLNPPVEKKIIDINEFDIPTRSQDEIRKSPSYTTKSPETAAKTFQDEINIKLQSLDFQQIKQKQKERNDILMRRFLNNEKLTKDEMQKVKEIIHCKRMLVEMNKLRMQKLATEHKYERLDANSNMKLHLKKIVETKPRKRFRNLYGDSSTSSDDGDASARAQNSRDPRINRRLHDETLESDYLAYQTKVTNGVPKIIIRRRLPNNVMQPYVKLERSPQIDLLAKRRRVC